MSQESSRNTSDFSQREFFQSTSENYRTKSDIFPSGKAINNALRDSIKEPSLLLRAQPGGIRNLIQHSRKLVSYSTHRLRTHQVSQLFESVFEKIQSNRTQHLDKMPTIADKWQKQRPLPDNIVGTLYRQNIKNYNGFVAALQAIEMENGMSVVQKERVSKLCHIGVAKEFLKTKKYSEGPKYSRVNVQIRPYMREKMHQEVKHKEQNYENVVFIPTNQLALSFNPRHYPKQLQDSVPPAQFQFIIKHVNSLIEQEYVRYKSSSLQTLNESQVARVTLLLAVLVLLVLLSTPAKELLLVMLGLAVVWVLLSVWQCRSKLEKLVRSKNVTNTILERINMYFQKINNQQTEWRVGQDFYWLEVHFIKKKNNFR